MCGDGDHADDDNLTRRRADERLRIALSETGFSGPAFDRFAEEYAAYGLAVCEAWLRSGEMFRRCALRGRPVPRPPQELTADDRATLATDVVVQGLRDLRENGLVRGGWTVDGGATMKSYFVTGLVHAFPNVFRRWLRAQADAPRTAPVTCDPFDTGRVDAAAPDDVERLVLLRIEVAEACADMSEYRRQVLVLRGQGYTHAEIAELLGKTPDAIERTLGRIRKSAERRGATGRGTSS